jgi:hypothetical protein
MRSTILPEQLRAKLADSRITRAGYYPEVAAAEIATRIVELRMVEDVEPLSANLKCDRFRDTRILHNPEIRIQDAWTVEEAPVGGSELAELLRRKSVRKEIRVRSVRPWLAWVLRLDFTDQIGRVR